MNSKRAGLLAAALLPLAALGAAQIPVVKLGVEGAPGKVVIRAVLAGAIPEVATDLVTIAGPAKHVEPARQDVETVCDVAAGERLQALRVRHEVSAADRAELKKFAQNNAAPHVMKFSDCPKYGEAIKSSKTVSRTLLPENFVPRVAMGTVETTGPDQVGAHRHAMLEQLFLGLKDNDITVIADGMRANLAPLSILHIPTGSSHGAEVAAGNRLHYVWMDFFATKEGQEWLKMHKPVTEPKAGKK